MVCTSLNQVSTRSTKQSVRGRSNLGQHAGLDLPPTRPRREGELGKLRGRAAGRAASVAPSTQPLSCLCSRVRGARADGAVAIWTMGQRAEGPGSGAASGAEHLVSRGERDVPGRGLLGAVARRVAADHVG